MRELVGHVLETFQDNVDCVLKLADFDHVVLEFAIRSVQAVHDRARRQGITNYLFSLEKCLNHLKTIRENDSMRVQYEHVFNQCVVLLVSYFGSAVTEIFGRCVSQILKTAPPEGVLKEELKLSIAELFEINYDVSEHVGEFLIRKKDISFQDMQSISRAFKTYAGFSPERDADVNTIIVGQACRHAIVHAGGVVDERLVKQVARATPRHIKEDLAHDARIQFDTNEITILAESMKKYLEKLVAGLSSG